LQMDKTLSGMSVRYAIVTSFTPGSVAANSATPINVTGVDINVGEQGLIFVGTPTTNAIKFGSVSCATAGTAAVALVNPTAGALTPTAASAAAPYTMILFNVPGAI
jgi:hypothetical protein